MNKFRVKVSQNGGEYYGFVYINCKELEKISTCEIMVDGNEMVFDEKIIGIEELTDDKFRNKTEHIKNMV